MGTRLIAFCTRDVCIVCLRGPMGVCNSRRYYSDYTLIRGSTVLYIEKKVLQGAATGLGCLLMRM